MGGDSKVMGGDSWVCFKYEGEREGGFDGSVGKRGCSRCDWLNWGGFWGSSWWLSR